MGRERDPSWEKIAVALESSALGESELADELREKFCKIVEPPRECSYLLKVKTLSRLSYLVVSSCHPSIAGPLHLCILVVFSVSPTRM